MTRVFTPEGESYAVSVVAFYPISLPKSSRKRKKVILYSGHNGQKKDKHPKSLQGHFKKNSLVVEKDLEFRVQSEDLDELSVGNEINLEIFEEGQNIDVQGKVKERDLLELSRDGISKCKMPSRKLNF